MASLAHDPGGKVKLKVPEHWKSTAEFSECGRYRYKLERVFDESNPRRVLMVLMNPSIADEIFNDPSNNRCCRFAQDWGYGGLLLGNVCGFRATNKQMLLGVDDPVGLRNLPALLEMAAQAEIIVVAHGILPGNLQRHATNAVKVLRWEGHRLHILKLSKLGQPKHVLYLPGRLTPQIWS